MIKIHLFLIFVLAFWGYQGVFAQPTISVEQIPSDIHPEVKKKIEQLYSRNPVVRRKAATELGERCEERLLSQPSHSSLEC